MTVFKWQRLTSNICVDAIMRCLVINNNSLATNKWALMHCFRSELKFNCLIIIKYELIIMSFVWSIFISGNLYQPCEWILQRSNIPFFRFWSLDFDVNITSSTHEHAQERERIADAFVTIEKLLIKCKYFPPLTSTHNFLVRILSRSLDDVRLATVKHYVQVNDAIGEYEHYMCNE